MKKILSIVGPTASGKTDLAFFLAKNLLDSGKFERVCLISADSRQVYQGLEITTGADLPADFSFISGSSTAKSYWQNPSKNLHLYGLSIIQADEEWSLGHFCTMTKEIIENEPETSFFILVGGTGLYHKHFLSTDGAITIKPNPEIRKRAEKLTLSELQSWLKESEPAKFEQMNHSDVNNPRRLIRALEIASSPTVIQQKNLTNDYQHQYFGLELDLATVEQKINQRVGKRWQSGAINEVQQIINRYPAEQIKKLPCSSATGFKEIGAYLSDQLDAVQAQKLWSLHELQYAKRQKTWWKKYAQGFWQKAAQQNSSAIFQIFLHELENFLAQS